MQVGARLSDEALHHFFFKGKHTHKLNKSDFLGEK